MMMRGAIQRSAKTTIPSQLLYRKDMPGSAEARDGCEASAKAKAANGAFLGALSTSLSRDDGGRYGLLVVR